MVDHHFQRNTIKSYEIHLLQGTQGFGDEILIALQRQDVVPLGEFVASGSDLPQSCGASDLMQKKDETRGMENPASSSCRVDILTKFFDANLTENIAFVKKHKAFLQFFILTTWDFLRKSD